MNKKENIVLSYQIYDLDNNILDMNTKIIMEQLVNNTWIEIQVSTNDFTIFRKNSNYRIPLKQDGTQDFDKAYSNFKDTNNDNIFLNDVIDAITNKQFAPSYKAFKKCMIQGKLFAIVSARGHEPNTIRRGVEYFIETQLTNAEKIEMKENLKYYSKLFNKNITNHNELLDNYLSVCSFIGVTSNYFIETFLNNKIRNIEDSKKLAVELFSKRCIKYSDKLKSKKVKVKIGFSDDDKNNLFTISELFSKEMKKEFPNVEFSIFDTSKNDDGSKNYTKITY